MAFRIGNRVTSTIGILLILFFVTSSVSHLLTQRVRDDVILLFYGSEKQAEITILRSALQSLSEALDKQGETLDRAGGSPQKRDALRAIDKLIAENAGTIEAYLAAEIPPAFENPQAIEKSLARENAFASAIAAYEKAGLTADERAWLARLQGAFAALTRLSGTVLGIVEQRRGLLSRFEPQRYRIGAEPGDQPPSSPALPDRRRLLNDVSASITMNIWFLLTMTLLGVIIGGFATVLLTRGLVQPIMKLTEGAEAIGNGDLDHRIEIDSKDELGQLAASFNRMAENRQQNERRLQESAYHDALTKLPNRTYFQIRLAEALRNAERVGRKVAVHCLDLDHFKDVNDTLGHPAGDDLLKQVSQRLLDSVRSTDTVARLGGDEFAIIQSNLLHEDGITVLAERVVAAIAEPFDLEGEQVFTGTSIGITVYPNDDTDPDQLFKNADLALYQAKMEGRSNYRLYDPVLNEQIHARKALEQDIRQALDQGDFYLNYQPQIEIATGRMVGVEALVRWNHPQRGMVSPAEFIPVAEQARLINRLTDFVLGEACQQAKAWQDAGLPAITVSVNLSPADFKRQDIVSIITATLERSGLAPQCLELEITEGMVMSGVEAVIETLDELSALGVELAIDDFGTGFSSMNYLKKFPVDRLKIDQTFIRDVLTSEEDAGITKAIIQLGHSLNLEVIAEGVETAQQLEFLREWGCDEAQGYHFSRPIPPDELAVLLEAERDERGEPKQAAL